MAVFDGVTPAVIGAANAAAESGYEIERSLRFNTADSTYLSRTASAGDRRTQTFSFWHKSVTSGQPVFFNQFTSGTQRFTLQLTPNFQFISYNSTGTLRRFQSNASFRDHSAWYHIVVSLDTRAAGASNRIKVWVNGEQLTAQTYVAPAQDEELWFNQSGSIEMMYYGSGPIYYSGYLADVHFIDGLALEASDFGEYDGNNVWQPKAYEGDYNRAAIDYSGDSVLTGTIYGGAGSISNLFDGTDTGVGPNTGSFITFTPSTPITINSSLRVKGNVSNAATDAIFAINGSNVSTVSEGFPAASGITQPSTTWTTISSPPATLTSLKFGWETTGSWFSVSGIEVDGVVLLDLDAGVNGFHLDFSDNSSAAALGTDSSGNSNTWTVNNISVSPGAGNDSLIDSPTNYTADSGNNGGNYATLNPLVTNSTTTLANGNLNVTSTGQTNAVSSIVPSSGKWYFEITLGSIVTNSFIGLYGTTPLNSSYVAYGINGYGFLSSGWGSPTSTITGTGVAGDIIGLAFDADAKTLEYYKNGSSIGTISGWTYVENWSIGFSANASISTPWVFNFGQRPFAYTPPTNYLSLCTTNLTAPTIADGGTAMNAALYTGNGASNSITGLGFAPDILWIKSRSNATFPALANSVVGPNYFLRTNSTFYESGPGYNDDIVSFDSDGFTLGADTYYAFCNTNTYTYVGWAWDSGTTTESNTDGTITSQVRANQSAGVSIVSYTGNGSTSPYPTIGHGLNAVPKLIITKSRDTAAAWTTYTTVIDGTLDFLSLNSTDKANSSSLPTSPDSSIFQVGGSTNNANGDDCLAFCFAPVEGYSAIGSYTGNGNADGPFVYTGFRPKWILLKESSVAGNNWNIYDSSRNEYNVTDAQLKASSGDAEATNTFADFLSNGFKIRSSTSGLNANTQTHIYAAFAEHPFKTARAR